MSSPPSAPRPVGVGIGMNPCPASTRPSPGEGFPWWGGAPRCECQEREDADTQPLRWGAWAPHRHRSPSPSWTRRPGLLELSLEPPAGSKRDPRETRSSGGQEVLQSLEAIKGQAPSRQGGVTQGARRPSPADRTTGVPLSSYTSELSPDFPRLNPSS